MAQVLVEACLAAVGKVLQDETRELVDNPPGPKTRGEEDPASPSARKDDSSTAKRIRFDVKENRYEVTFQDDEGKMNRTVKGLSVRLKRSAAASTGTSIDEAMNRAYNKAKALWDHLDKSGKPRFSDE